MSVRQIPHSSAEGSGDPLGRVAFRLRIAVTGHRKLSHALERDLAECVQVQFDRLVERLPAHKSTHIELTVISQLAEGADRFVVHQVLSNAATGGRQATLEAVLPLHRDAYARIQGFDATSREDFDALLGQATAVDEPSPTVDGDSGNAAAAYEAAGRKIIARCDVLLAIWDGHRTGGRGGTAETLLEAASAGKPCVWIPADPAEPVQDNLTREQVTSSATSLPDALPSRQIALVRRRNCRGTYGNRSAIHWIPFSISTASRCQLNLTIGCDMNFAFPAVRTTG